MKSRECSTIETETKSSAKRNISARQSQHNDSNIISLQCKKRRVSPDCDSQQSAQVATLLATNARSGHQDMNRQLNIEANTIYVTEFEHDMCREMEALGQKCTICNIFTARHLCDRCARQMCTHCRMPGHYDRLPRCRMCTLELSTTVSQ